jgi:hypothetical protein
MWLTDPDTLPRAVTKGSSLEWQRQSRNHSPVGPRVSVPMPQARLVTEDGIAGLLEGEVLIPPTAPGIAELLDRTRVTVLAVAKPGVRLAAGDRLPRALDGFSVPDDSSYNFVVGLRGLVWPIGSVILWVGLLAFASRRRTGRCRDGGRSRLFSSFG